MAVQPQGTPAIGRPGIRWGTWFRRAAATVLVALAVGTTSSAAMRWDATFQQPPGFGRGLLHGALMPLAWPTLLAGRDQTIYSERNLGRTYKMGYSMGVNVCGMAFFGWFFTRLRRWTRNGTESRP
jgi:uncharacterized transporter YbjL